MGVILPAQGTGATEPEVATETIAGEEYQLMKLVDGTAAATTVIKAGEGVAANALRTTIASDSAVIGGVTETAPATDTASSGLNGRLQRIAQRITSLITALGTPLQAGGNVGTVTTVSNVTDLAAKIGEVQASPTSNTVLDRLKALLTGIVLAAGTAIIGKVGIDQTTPGTTNAVQANAGTNLNTSALALESGGNLAAAATSLAVLDDFDESDRCKVNTIVGQAGISAGAGAVAANTPRVTLASDDPAVTAISATRTSVQSVGSQIRFVGSGFSPAINNTNWTIGSPTDVTLTLASLASAAARQSNKVDLGANRANAYEVLGCVDFTGETPTQGSRVSYYWLPSTSATAATGNVMGGAGADAACPTGSETGTPTLADILAACVPIGNLYLHDGACVQNGFVGVFRPTSRYGQLVVVNNGGDVLENDDVENHQVFNPIVDTI